MGLVEVREPEYGLQIVFPRRHPAFLDTVDEEPVVRGHAAERSYEDFRDENRRHRALDLTPCDLVPDRPEIGLFRVECG